MISRKYRYDPKTCRFVLEPVPIRFAILYVISLLMCSAFVFFLITLAQDHLVLTEAEQELQKQNKILKTYKASFHNELLAIERLMDTLSARDEHLHEQLFSSMPEDSAARQSTLDQAILLADAKQFKRALRIVRDKTEKEADRDPLQMFNAQTITHLRLGQSELANIPVMAPIEGITGNIFTSGFGKRIHPFHKGLYDHPGIDLSVPAGTPVFATANGKVKLARVSTLEAGYGTFIELDHGNGIVTRYAHLQDIAVKVGQSVRAGQQIGTSGNSGASAIPHLHYEVLHHGEPTDPLPYLIKDISPELHDELVKKGKTKNQSLD